MLVPASKPDHISQALVLLLEIFVGLFHCVLHCCAPLPHQTNAPPTDVVMVCPLEKKQLVLESSAYSVSLNDIMFLQHITMVLFRFQTGNNWKNDVIWSVLYQCSPLFKTHKKFLLSPNWQHMTSESVDSVAAVEDCIEKQWSRKCHVHIEHLVWTASRKKISRSQSLLLYLVHKHDLEIIHCGKWVLFSTTNKKNYSWDLHNP